MKHNHQLKFLNLLFLAALLSSPSLPLEAGDHDGIPRPTGPARWVGSMDIFSEYKPEEDYTQNITEPHLDNGDRSNSGTPIPTGPTRWTGSMDIFSEYKPEEDNVDPIAEPPSEGAGAISYGIGNPYYVIAAALSYGAAVVTNGGDNSPVEQLGLVN